MSGDVRLITNVDSHLKDLGQLASAKATSQREAGLVLLDSSPTKVILPPNTSTSSLAFVPLEKVASLKTPLVSKSAAVSIHPPTNVSAPLKPTSFNINTDTMPAKRTEVVTTRPLPPSVSKPASSFAWQSPTNFTTNLATTSIQDQVTPLRGSSVPHQDLDSIDASPPTFSKKRASPNSSRALSDDILGFTPDDGLPASKKAKLTASAPSSSYDSNWDDIIDTATQDSMRGFRGFGSATAASAQPPTSMRLSSMTSVSKDYDPYALVQRRQSSEQPSTALPTTTTHRVSSPEPSTEPTIPLPDLSERNRLNEVLQRATFEYKKAKMLLESCAMFEDLDTLGSNLSTASAKLKSAQASLDAWDRQAGQTSQRAVSPAPFSPQSNPMSSSGSFSRPQQDRGMEPSTSSYTPSTSTYISRAPSTSYNNPSTNKSWTNVDEADDDELFASVLDTPAPVRPPSRSSLESTSRNGDFTRSTTISTVATPTKTSTWTSSHLESGFSTSSNAVPAPTNRAYFDRSNSIAPPPAIVEVDDDEFDVAALEQIEYAATARTAVRSVLPSTTTECTSTFESIPQQRGINVEQYDPRTALTSRWHSHSFEWSPRVNSAIQRTFGHQQWRTNQLEIVNAVMAKKDVFVTMPTGGGKSLCYQVPALASEGVTVVIQPLISLIEDQMMILSGLDIPCAFLCGKDYNGQWGRQDVEGIIADVRASPCRVKVLFITPERLTTNTYILHRFAELSRFNLLTMFVVDECHCVSQWGHEFRPHYKELSRLKETLPEVPILALTATATVVVKIDILTVLKFFDKPSNVVCFTSSFNRPNLYFEVRPKVHKVMMDEIESFIKERSGRSGIIYCLSRKDTSDMSAELNKRGFNSGFYHADMTVTDRSDVQSRWYNNELQFICATIAFGMGINKPDVRWVIHASIPKSLEGFYQEAGRAGRDGDAAECLVFYSGVDITLLKRMALANGPHNPFVANDPIHANLMRLSQLVTFLEDRSVCRRTLLMDYFGEKDSTKGVGYNCGNCDTCLNPSEAFSVDVTSMVSATIAVYKEIILEPNPPREKGKKYKCLHFYNQVASGVLREKLLEKGHMSFLDSKYGIKTKAEQRAFFDYVFSKLIQKEIFIDVSSMAEKRGHQKRLPAARFMYEISKSSPAVRSLERGQYNMSVVWKHPPKGTKRMMATAAMLEGLESEEEEDDLIMEGVPVGLSAPASKKRKRTASAKSTASSKKRTSITKSGNRLAIPADDVLDLSDDEEEEYDPSAVSGLYVSEEDDHPQIVQHIPSSSSSASRPSSTATTPTSAKKSTANPSTGIMAFLGNTSPPTNAVSTSPTNTSLYSSDLNGSRGAATTAAAPANNGPSFQPTKFRSPSATSSNAFLSRSSLSNTNSTSMNTTATTGSSPGSAMPLFRSTSFSGSLGIQSNPPLSNTMQGIIESAPTSVGGDVFDDLDPDVLALLADSSKPSSSTRASSSSSSHLSSSSITAKPSSSIGAAIFGRPAFITSKPTSASKPTSSVLSNAKKASLTASIFHDSDEDDDDDFLQTTGFSRPVASRSPKKTAGPIDPQKSLRDKLVTSLKKLKNQIAKEESYNSSGATTISSLFPDTLLQQLSYELPTDSTKITNVNGMGEKRSEKYGARLLCVIGEYLQKHPELRPWDPATGKLGSL